MYPSLQPIYRLTEDQLENIVENEVASGAIWKELEGLAVIHGSLLIIDLQIRISRNSSRIFHSTVMIGFDNGANIPREHQ